MKFIPDQIDFFLRKRSSRHNLKILLYLLLVLAGLIAIFSVIFHVLMLQEGRQYSWFTGVYWTLTVMSTLGFGDITFTQDLGMAFTMCVLMSGVMFMLILLPFTFLQFFYTPWMEAQYEARAPRQLPRKNSRPRLADTLRRGHQRSDRPVGPLPLSLFPADTGHRGGAEPVRLGVQGGPGGH